MIFHHRLKTLVQSAPEILDCTLINEIHIAFCNYHTVIIGSMTDSNFLLSCHQASSMVAENGGGGHGFADGAAAQEKFFAVRIKPKKRLSFSWK